MPREDSSLTEGISRSRTFRSLARGGRRYALPWLSLHRWRRRVMLVGATMLAGLVAILFAIGADLAIEAHERLMDISPLLSLLVAPAGFAAMAYLCTKYFPGTQGSGIPQTIAAAVTADERFRHSLLSMRIVVGKVLLTLGGLLSGAAIGREGPSVQIGASILSLLADRKKHRIAPARDLIIAGGAAGIAAAFNTPLGGIMFAIEELSRKRPFMANSTTLIAVIFAGLMSLGTLGNYTYFGITEGSLGWPQAVWPIVLCGAAGGLLGGLFTRLLTMAARRLPGRLGRFARRHPIRLAAACGLATAILGLLSSGLTYGTGYAEVRSALEGTTELPIYYCLAKATAIALAFISGIPGGLFAPALAVGAGIGSDIAAFFPDAQSSALLALGMVAFLAGITQSPITSFVIVMEMISNHRLLLPLMCASVIAHGFSRSVAPTPLYDAIAFMLERRYRPVRHALQAGEAKARESQAPAPPPDGDESVARPVIPSATAALLSAKPVTSAVAVAASDGAGDDHEPRDRSQPETVTDQPAPEPVLLTKPVRATEEIAEPEPEPAGEAIAGGGPEPAVEAIAGAETPDALDTVASDAAPSPTARADESTEPLREPSEPPPAGRRGSAALAWLKRAAGRVTKASRGAH